MGRSGRAEPRGYTPPPVEDLLPRAVQRRSMQGMRTFTSYRAADQSGVSGTGIVLEGVIFATGVTVIHWLQPAPHGSLNIFDTFEQFLEIHVTPHPGNHTVITFDDETQLVDGEFYARPPLP